MEESSRVRFGKVVGTYKPTRTEKMRDEREIRSSAKSKRLQLLIRK